MGDLEPIITAILNDAKIRASSVCEMTDKRIDRMRKEFEREKEILYKNFEKEIDLETERIYESERIRGRQMTKSAHTRAKADSVKEVINCAKDRVLTLSDKEYSDFLKQMFEKNSLKDVIVYLNERDKKRVKKSVFRGAEIAKESISASGGFVAVDKKISYDYTIDSLFSEKYNEICDKINEIYGKERQ